MRTLQPIIQKLIIAICVTLIGSACTLWADTTSGSTNDVVLQSVQDNYTSIHPLPQSSPDSPAIVQMKELPDGTSVCINQKCVVESFPGYIYIEEADRSSGIRLQTGDQYLLPNLQKGNLISCSGKMTTIGAERAVIATSPIQFDPDTVGRLGSVGMSTPAILGWPKNVKVPAGPRSAGLLPFGLYVKVWGKVIEGGLLDDESNWYMYLDDGYNKLDWTDPFLNDGTHPVHTGIRVYVDKIPDETEKYLIAEGVLCPKVFDPTPYGPDGDSFIIPVIRLCDLAAVYSPTNQTAPETFGTIQGTVRLIGQSTPGKRVHVYSEFSEVTLNNVTSGGSAFTLSNIPQSGIPVTASAAGYISSTIIAKPGDNINLDLQPSDTYALVTSDVSSVAACNSERVTIRAIVHDCEGKRLTGVQIKLTTDRGSFEENQSKEIILTTDDNGFAYTSLTTLPDPGGTATVTATNYPVPSNQSTVSVVFRSPKFNIAASSQVINQPGTVNINAQLVDGSAGLANKLVTFKTNTGTFTTGSSKTYSTYTDNDGYAHTAIQLSSPGCANILVSYTDPCSNTTTGWLTVSYTGTPWSSAAVDYSNPLVTDLDGSADGKKELVVMTADGILTVLNASGSVIWTTDLYRPGGNTPACAVIDADRSGRPCIFVPSGKQQSVYAFTYNGKPLAGWPTKSLYIFMQVAPAIGDINLDGTPEITAGDECCYVFCWNPTGEWKPASLNSFSSIWCNITGNSGIAIYGSTCAIGDLDSDQLRIPDVVVGTGSSQLLFGFPGDAWGDFTNSPLYLPSWPKSCGSIIQTSPAIGDIDGDGKNDTAAGTEAGDIYIILSSGPMVKYATGSTIRSSAALADLDGDGKLDVVIGSNSGRVYAINWKGQALQGWEGGIRLNMTGNYSVVSSPVIGDINGDGQPEIVVGCNDGHVYGIYKDGRDHRENGAVTGPLAWAGCCISPDKGDAVIYSSPVIDDVNNDGLVEVMVAGTNGIYRFTTNSPYASDPVRFPWPTFHHDNQRTGCVVPIGPAIRASIQGIITRNGSPALGAKVYINNSDGSAVNQPGSTLPRSYVVTVGSATIANEVGKGSYCINQLDPNKTYKIKVVAADGTEKTIPDVAVTTGATRLDVAL